MSWSSLAISKLQIGDILWSCDRGVCVVFVPVAVLPVIIIISTKEP